MGRTQIEFPVIEIHIVFFCSQVKSGAFAVIGL